mgnify:CR=1 FL=1
MAIPTSGIVPEGIRLSEMLSDIVKKLKEKLADEIEDIAAIAFGLKKGGLIVLVHASREAAKKGTLSVYYTDGLGIRHELPEKADPDLLPRVFDILKEIRGEKKG